MSNWDDKMTKWGVPVDHLIKSKYKEEPPKHGGQALLSDPYSLQQTMGFKDRKYSLSYDMLKRVPYQLGIVASIIQTRCNQIASFSAPFRMSKTLGFEIKTKNPTAVTTKGQREMILSMEKFMYNCGHPTPNPGDPNNLKRDDFDTFLRKIVRDTLVYDQMTWEVIPTIKGTPYEFVAVDASTIRIAADSVGLVPDDSWYERQGVVNNPTLLGLPFNPYTSLKYARKDKKPAYVQVVNGQIVQVFTIDELNFGVRNPRTDLQIQGYGFSEIEQLVNVITAHLHAEEYNRKFFTQASAPKGILNFKGDNMGSEMLEAFKRQWHANITGVDNSWRMPVLQAEQGIDFIDLHRSNQDMEYSKWVEYLIKLITGVYAIDPAELNFDLSGGVSQTPLFESSSEWKLKASKDKGLKPLLRFIAKNINDSIISKIDDAFYFDFVGLDELTEQEKHELRTEQLASYLTLNEVRRTLDMPDVEDGNVVLNPVYLQAKTVQMQLDAQMSQDKQAANQALPQNPDQPEDATNPDPEAQNEQSEAPSYSSRFTKSVNNTKILEISLDDETWYDLVT